MPRWTTLVLAGALGWPAMINAQPWSKPTGSEGGAPTRPTLPPLQGSPAGGEISSPAPTPTTVPTAVVPVADVPAAGELPPVPPLPPTGPLPPSVSGGQPPEAFNLPQKPDELPKPAAPGAPVLAPAPRPDVSGMPPMKVYPPAMPHGGHYPAMPPGTYAPTIPPVCCPTEPPTCTTCNASGVLVFGDIMMLRARQSNPVAILQRIDAAVPTVVTSEIAQYNTDHTAAFRAGGGYMFENGWIFTATFTQYKDQTSENNFSVPVLGGASVFNVVYTGPGQSFGTPVDEPGETLGATWNVQTRTIDIAIGTVFSPSDCFDLTVSGGCRIAWFDQDYRVRLANVDAITSETLTLDLVGAGPMVQAEARVYLLPWLAGYSRALGTLLLADRDDVSSQTIVDATGAVQAIRTVIYDRDEVVPVCELAIGVEGSLFDGRFTINGGYEFHYWYELGTSFASQAGSQARDPNHADISFDGWYLRVNWLF